MAAGWRPMCVLLHVFWGPEVEKVRGARTLALCLHLGTPKNVGQNTHLPLPLLKVASLAWARGPGRGKEILSSLLAARPGENKILSSLLPPGPAKKILSSLLAAIQAQPGAGQDFLLAKNPAVQDFWLRPLSPAMDVLRKSEFRKDLLRIY